MNQKEIVDYWVSEADESLGVARHLFEKEDYSYALFFGHLAVEKILKAMLAQQSEEQVPRSHNLFRLAQEAGIETTDWLKHTLIRITTFNLESRYPDYKKIFRRKCTKQFTEQELERVEEIFKWLKSKL
ncbi:MAG: HEPN domain-containing protein [Candidatus Aegiribacteria sp.]|nr:HEPN domain-containing protein [Candidatus Aegiribacteria sp.]